MRRCLPLVLILGGTTLRGQDSTPLQPIEPPEQTRPRWFSTSDLKPIGIGAAAVALLSLTDVTVSQTALKPSLQHNRGLGQAADLIQTAGDPGVLLISASLYVAGRVAGHAQLTDASRHSIEALALSAAVTHSLKFAVGRARPNISSGQRAFAFHPFDRKPDFNSFPSGHTTAAFAAACVFRAELARSHPKAGRLIRPVLYGVATLVGGSRMNTSVTG